MQQRFRKSTQVNHQRGFSMTESLVAATVLLQTFLAVAMRDASWPVYIFVAAGFAVLLFFLAYLPFARHGASKAGAA